MSFYFAWQALCAGGRSAASRRSSKLAKLQKKGTTVSPVSIEGRTIATSFWGKSWCDNLERYSDYANRLPRGRTYVRNGSVLDLQIAKGEITAKVSGSELYTITITIAPVPADALDVASAKDCAGSIDSRGRAAAGPARQGRDGPGLPAGRRPVSVAEGDQAVVQLPGLGRHVQACGGGALWRRRAARPSSRSCCSCCAASMHRT